MINRILYKFIWEYSIYVTKIWLQKVKIKFNRCIEKHKYSKGSIKTTKVEQI